MTRAVSRRRWPAGSMTICGSLSAAWHTRCRMTHLSRNCANSFPEIPPMSDYDNDEDGFDWAAHDADIVIPSQGAVAAFITVDGRGVALWQRRCLEEDSCIVIGSRHLGDMIRRLTELADEIAAD